MAANGDIRVCFLGDSYVAGTGDLEHRGWVGILASRSVDLAGDLTVYNLGVRRDTSADVRARWQTEAARRLPAGVDGRVVLSFGVNDCAQENGRLRVPQPQAEANLMAILATAKVPVFVVGPPPVADDGQNERIAELDQRFAELCTRGRVPYVSVLEALTQSSVWRGEVCGGRRVPPCISWLRRTRRPGVAQRLATVDSARGRCVERQIGIVAYQPHPDGCGDWRVVLADAFREDQTPLLVLNPGVSDGR